MDGVLADLNTGLYNFNGFRDFQDRSALFKSHLPEYVKHNGFATQPKMPLADELVDVCLSHGKPLAILTSIGQFADNSEMTRQKRKWLDINFPVLSKVPFIATTSGKEKSKFSFYGTLLIDDHQKNCDYFYQHGGESIHYEESKFHQVIIDVAKFVENY